ncbi:putative Ig domain-containing protein, partial [Larkinella soli]|uniref:putative Ig domain-containing protein n=1 Tax=Larkinella soli TaxID=1770527 RepID=UPI000FFCB787
MTNFCTFLKRVALVLSVIVCSLTNGYSQYKPGFFEETYVSDLGGAVGFTFDKNGALYAWTIDGRVIRVDPQTKQKTELLNISSEVGRYDDFGLLSMCLDNNFLSNGRFYLFYVIKYAPVKYQGTYARVTRYEANPADNYRSIKPNSRKILIGAPDPNNPSKGVPGDCIPLLSSSHAGGGMTMGADGTLLIGTGDGAAPAFDEGSFSETYYSQAINNGFINPDENIGSYRSQVLHSLSGKVLRIDPETGDGIPSNPFWDGGKSARSPQNRIFAIGLRQPFRTGMRPNTGSGDPGAGNPGALYVGDVGFTDKEEINVVSRGANFGWPFFEGMDVSRRKYEKTQYKSSIDHTRPRIEWRDGAGRVNRNESFTNVNSTPAGVLPGYCSVGGNWHPGGGNYPAEYQNAYYFADFNGGWISRLGFDGSNQPLPETLTKLLDGGSTYQYITCIAFNPIDKNLYFMRYPEPGGERVRRIMYNGGSGGTPPVASITYDKNNGPSPLKVKFTGSNSYDPEGKSLTYLWDFGDNTTSTAANPEKTFTTNSATSTVYTVKLTVTDADGLSNQTQTTITVSNPTNTAPVIASTSLDGQDQMDLSSTRNINLSAVINDETPADQLSYKWTVSLFHNDHQHDDFITTSRTATASLPPIGCEGTLTFWYGVKLEVTDAGGLRTETMRYIYPNCSGTAQTINFSPIPDRAPNSPAFTPQATASSGKPVVFYVIEGPAQMVEGKVFLTGRLGKVTVRAAQHGGDGFNPARPVEQSFFVVSNASDKQAPTAPLNLNISNITQTSMRLAWNASTDNVSVAGYEVYQNNNKITDGLVTSLNYTVNNLNPDTEYYFFIRAVDPTGNVSPNSNTATARTLAGTPTNQPPTAPAAPTLTATVNSAYSVTLPTFTDPNGDPLTYALTGTLPSGVSFNAQTRVLSGTPTQTGTFNLTYSATDNKNAKTDLAVTLTVAASQQTNQPPTAPFVPALVATANQAYSTTLPVFTDPNGDPLTYALTGTLPSGVSFNAQTRVLSGTPTQTGTFNLTYSATDNKNAKTDLAVTLTVAASQQTNQPPTAPFVPALVATANQAYSTTLPVFTDPNGDPLTYALTGTLPSGVSFNAQTRVLSGTPTQTGNFTLTYSATDNKNAKTDVSVSLTVNGAGPVTGTFEGYLDVAGCSTIEGWAFNYDSPNAALTIEFVENGNVVGSVVANIFRQDLLNNGKGNGVHGYRFTVPESLKDNQPHSISGRVLGTNYILVGSPKSITCEGSGTPTNQPPVAPAAPTLTATVNSAYSTTLPVFTDPNGDPLT